jgi:polar amino acid transport system substrate-binding protein
VLAALAAPLLLGSLAGCGAGSAQGTAAEPSPVTVYPNALTVCSDTPYAPFEFRRNGQDVGFDIDIAQQVADALEVRLDVVAVSFDDIVNGSALNADTCDMAISAMTISGDRARVLDFSSHYFVATQVLLAAPDSGITGLGDVGGRRVAVQSGTTGDAYVRDHAPGGVEIVRLGNLPAIRGAMQDGSVDAAVIDNPIAPRLVRTTGFQVIEEFDTGENYGIGVKKDGNPDLLRMINRVLSAIKEDGTYDEIYDTWFKA